MAEISLDRDRPSGNLMSVRNGEVEHDGQTSWKMYCGRRQVSTDSTIQRPDASLGMGE